MKSYWKAQYYLPVLGFVFIVFYVLYLLIGGEVGAEPRRDSLDRSGTGYFLFYRLFKQLGYPVRRWYDAELPEKGGCLFYFDYYPGEPDPETLERMMAWVKRGNRLFLVGIHADTDPVLEYRVVSGPAREVAISKKLTTQPLEISFPRSNCLMPGSGAEVLIRSESGALLVNGRLGSGRVYIFADNNLFVNRYFTNPHHAVLLNELLKHYYNGHIYIYEYGTGAGAYRVKNPVMVLFKGDFLWVTLHLLLVGLIFAAWKGRRFGRPLRLDPLKRRSIDVHLAAVGGFYQKTGAYRLVESLSQKYLIYKAKQLLNLKKNLSRGELAKIISQYTGKSPGQIMVLLEEPGGIPEPMLITKRRAIYSLIKELQGCKK
jgi:hypothetical protein